MQSRQPPKNRYRVATGTTEVVYRKPLSLRIGSGFMAAFAAALSLCMLWGAAARFGLFYVPGVRENSGSGLILLLGFALIGLMSLYILMSIGTQELRVSLSDKTYTFKSSAPLPNSITKRLSGIMRFAREELGVPWRTTTRSGPCSDMAGVALQATAAGEATYYAIWLYWNKDEILPMRLAWIGGEDAARCLLEEACRELGVVILPDQPAIRRNR